MELTIKRFDQLSTPELYEILRVRSAVFVVEQNCAYQDIDGEDLAAHHLWLRDEAGLKAYLRLLSLDEHTAKIGRVLTVERGKGHGARLLRAGIAAARDVLKKRSICIEAQSYAIGFYEREGFQVISEEFLEDGIPHVRMRLDL